MIIPAIAPVFRMRADNVVQLRMRQRLAARDADHRRPQPPQVVDPPQHLVQRHRLGNLVVLIAVGAAQVAEPRRDNLRQHRMRRRRQRARHHRVLARLPRAAIHRPRTVDLRGIPILTIETQQVPLFSRSLLALKTPP